MSMPFNFPTVKTCDRIPFTGQSRFKMSISDSLNQKEKLSENICEGKSLPRAVHVPYLCDYRNKHIFYEYTVRSVKMHIGLHTLKHPPTITLTLIL